ELTRASYVAAQAFPGTYEVTIRRLWGTPLGGKVRLEVIQHQGTPQEERSIGTVQIGQRYSFTLQFKDGRRTELAALPPPENQEAKKAAPARKRATQILLEIADPDFAPSGGGIFGGFGAPAAARPVHNPQAQANQSERLTYQGVVSGMGPGVGL